jgi:hypothetical protein
LAARADESVTFQVDMSRYTNSAGAQVATVVDVRGGFNGWNSGWNLVNNGANVYTNTFTVTGAAATDHAYKFTYTTLAGLTWEDNINPPTSNDRHLILTGSAQTLPVVAFYAPSVAVPIDIALQPVTFTVDMNAQPSAASVYVRGDFNGWGTGNPLTNNGSGIWSTTINVPGVAGTLVNCKYFYTPGDAWEGGGDRQFQLTGGAQTLPLTNKWDDKYEYPSNIFNLTFQVDMTVQGVSFINAGGVVTASGGINGWGNTAVLTNNPALPYPSNWIYSGTWQVATFLVPPVVPSGLSGDAKKNQYNRYKYRANGGWEEPANSPNYSGNDRSFITSTPGDVVLPLVLYSDASLCDVLVQDTTVKFQLHLTNGTVATDGHVFDNTVDTVHINGESLLGAWQSWDIFLPQLNRDGTSDIYTNTFLIPAGRPLNQKVKYSVNGLDNEAPTYDDHIQWIRTTNTTYVMSVVEFGTNYAAARVQKQWGDLTVGAPAGGNVPVNWLGCPCVTLQSRTSVGSGSWINLPATESASSTNVPNTGAEQYFRLEKRITR